MVFMGIELRHNEHQTTLSIEEIISTALQNDSDELELAISLMFDEDSLSEYEGDEAEEYYSYFEEVVTGIRQHLGEPCFQGAFDSPDIKQWKSEICPSACADYLVVWSTPTKKLYIRYSQIDSEGEIVVAFGAEGCKCQRNTDWEHEYAHLL